MYMYTHLHVLAHHAVVVRAQQGGREPQLGLVGQRHVLARKVQAQRRDRAVRPHVGLQHVSHERPGHARRARQPQGLAACCIDKPHSCKSN